MATASTAPSLRRTAAPAVLVSGVSKSFLLPHERYGTVKDRLLHPFTTRDYEVLHALKNVDLRVERGEFFGVVGRNGSGKSTLLRCISGIYTPDAGDIELRGRLASFIELGLGFHPELAARDNVVTSAVMFGLSPREARSRFEEIVAFAELGRFVDQKLKNYSTGMAVRLAFSVAVHVNADVLLFDEVLAVGDESFQRKCFAHFDRLRGEGKTIVLVTHRMEEVRRFCHRALLLHRGEVVATGDSDAVARKYEELNREGEPPARVAAVAPPIAAPRRRPHPLLGPDPRRFMSLIETLAISNFRVKYTGTSLNYLWAIARPLALFGVLLAVFQSLGRFDRGVTHYPALLLVNVILWTFFTQVTAGSVECLVARAPILRKLPFPHLAVPLSVGLGAAFDLGINLIVVVVVALAMGITPGVGWLEMPILICLLAVLTTGLSLLLAALYVRHRDVAQVWVVTSQTIFYLTPIFYMITLLPHPWDRIVILANPLAAIFTESRHAFVDPSAPSAAEVAGGAPFLLIPLATVFATLAIGLWVFRRESPRAAEHV